jgi:hypothetical protein
MNRYGRSTPSLSLGIRVEESFCVSPKLDFIHFYETQRLMLKPLLNYSFSFGILSRLSNMEKVFAKKLRFLPDKGNQVLNFG